MMVDRVDIPHVNDLYQELNHIDGALTNFSEGGRISTMTIAPGAPPLPENGHQPPVSPPAIVRLAVTISVPYIDYPPGMVDAIKSALEGRRQAIEQELENIGVTGIAEGR